LETAMNRGARSRRRYGLCTRRRGIAADVL
jgi:hypothetical protein